MRRLCIFTVSLLLLGLACCGSATTYRMFVIPASIRCEAWAVNDRGEVTGLFNTGEQQSENRAYLYSRGVFRDLGSISPNTSSRGVAINNSSTVFVWDVAGSGAARAFLNTRGAVQVVDNFGFQSCYPMGLNDNGVAVGVLQSGDDWRPFKWESGQHTLLPRLFEQGNSAAAAVNDLGEIVGWNGFRAVRWTMSGPQLIPGLGLSRALSINRNGQIVGDQRSNYDYLFIGGSKPFVYSGGVTVVLNAPGGAIANDLNDAGVVVGTHSLSFEWEHFQKGFVWEAGVLTNLDDLVVNLAGATIRQAHSINNSGIIAATAYNDAWPGFNDTKGVLLIPTSN